MNKNISLFAIFRTFFIIGATSFGGGVVAYLREAIVERKQWMDEHEFLATLEISQTMPGLNTVNISILTGDKLAGVKGAIIAFIAMLLPGTVFVFLLGFVYAGHSTNKVVMDILAGTAAAAVGMLIAVTIKIGKKQFLKPKDAILIAITFICSAILKLHLAEILLLIAPVAIYLNRPIKENDAS